jgi:hypothetical protein
MHRGAGGETPVIDGTIGRSEFGVEIFVAVGYLTYVAGLSIDKVCELLEFFWKLKLSKSQADALLNRLGSEWEPVFDDLCELLANATVVHADETSWSINSVWAFISSQARLLIYGVHKDADTLLKIVDKNTFTGTMVSDNAAVYQNFSKAQKCWAHLIRKAFKLTLARPERRVSPIPENDREPLSSSLQLRNSDSFQTDSSDEQFCSTMPTPNGKPVPPAVAIKTSLNSQDSQINRVHAAAKFNARSISLHPCNRIDRNSLVSRETPPMSSCSHSAPYSRLAIVSCTLSVAALATFVALPLILLTPLSIALAIISRNHIRSRRIVGGRLAFASATLSASILFASPIWFACLYNSEAPPNHARVAFASIVDEGGRAFDKYEGQQICIKGYAIPTNPHFPQTTVYMSPPRLSLDCNCACSIRLASFESPDSGVGHPHS